MIYKVYNCNEEKVVLYKGTNLQLALMVLIDGETLKPINKEFPYYECGEVIAGHEKRKWEKSVHYEVAYKLLDPIDGICDYACFSTRNLELIKEG